jgi:enolase
VNGAAVTDVRARRMWDSRGRPTIEVELVTSGGACGRALAPAGASRGSGEAVDRRDGGPALGGYDVTAAVAAVHTEVRPALLGLDVTDQETIDATLTGLDPTPNLARLGGNVAVATSMAALHTAAAVGRVPLWRHLDPHAGRLPRPEIQIIGGGAHAGRRIDLQDLMVVPLSATTIEQALVDVAEVYLAVGAEFARRGPAHGVADEGGYWPALRGNEEALAVLLAGIERAGFAPGRDIGVSLDVAASEFEADGRYRLAADGREYDWPDWLDTLAGWVDRYAVVAVEDPASERQAGHMREATARLAGRALVVGDDFLVTNAARISAAASAATCTTALIKPNQAGTVTATRAAVDAARMAGWSIIVSARSGETEDVTVAHLAVGWRADLLKVGSIARGERTAKWNELIRIDAQLGGGLPLAPLPAPAGHSRGPGLLDAQVHDEDRSAPS